MFCRISMFLRSISLKFQRICIQASRIKSSYVKKKYLCTSILPLAYCTEDIAKKLSFSKDELTHAFLIRQASRQTVNSALLLLNEALAAILDTSEKYELALNELLALVEECQSNLGNELLQQEAADLIIERRSDVADYKKQLVELESLMEYIEKVVESTTETSFLVGAEHASISLSEQLHAAKQEILRIKKAILILESDYLKAQQFFIESSAKFEEKKKK